MNIKLQSFICSAFLLVFFQLLSANDSFAYSVIEAESYADMVGVQLENNNTTVGYIDGGDWLLYTNIDFGNGPAAIVMNIAKAGSGGLLELRIDAIDGPLLAHFYPTSTGSWGLFQEQKCNISQVNGLHDLYIIAKNADGVCNIDYFMFTDIGVYEPNWVLHWSDEFNGNELDETVWSKVHHGNPDNGELQFYTPRNENILVSDGTLKLIARKETYTAQGPWMSAPATRYYTSGKIESQGKLTFQYGKIEARMKLPRGKGTWPAFWMLGENLFDAGVGWPKCGEIDIMEHGQDFNHLGAAIHTESYNHTIGTQKTGTYIISDYDTDFHIYGVIWSENELNFYVDGNYYFTLTKEQIGSSVSEWPFDQPFWLVLNHAVGGAWGGTPDDALFPHVTEVDWVRVYKDIPLSISDNQRESLEVSIYPNPGDGICWITNEQNLEIVSAEVYDINSKLIKQFNYSGSCNVKVDMSGLERGIYIIRINHTDKTISKKFIKR